MSKSDFEFYSLGENLPEFVIPAPASDPYNGEFTPVSDVASLVIDSDVIRQLFDKEGWSTTISTGPDAQGSDFNDRFLSGDIKRLIRGINPDYAHQSFVTVSAELPKDIDEQQTINKINELYDGFKYGEVPKGYKSLKEYVDDLAETTKAKVPYIHIPSGHLYEHPFLTNTKGPTNPHVTFAEGLLQKVYEWLPGPERQSSTGEVLNPTFSPRPASLLSVCSVKIELINPATVTS